MASRAQTGSWSTVSHCGQGAGDDLRALSIAADDARQAVKSNDDLMERLAPGWKAYGEGLDARVAASSEAEAKRRDSKAALLDSSPKAELVEHWQRLGGEVPSPICVPVHRAANYARFRASHRLVDLTRACDRGRAARS